MCVEVFETRVLFVHVRSSFCCMPWMHRRTRERYDYEIGLHAEKMDSKHFDEYHFFSLFPWIVHFSLRTYLRMNLIVPARRIVHGIVQSRQHPITITTH